MFSKPEIVNKLTKKLNSSQIQVDVSQVHIV